MAITVTQKISEHSGGANAASYTTTATLTPAANKLYIAVVAEKPTSSPDTAPSLSGGGLTWTQIDTQVTSNSGRRISFYRALSASPGSAATITVTFNTFNADSAYISVTEFAGTDTSGTNGSGAIVQFHDHNDSGTSVTTYDVTMGTFGNANNVGLAGFAQTTGGTPTKDATAGWTALYATGDGANLGFITEWRTGTDTTFTATGASAKFCGIGIEIKASSATNFTQTNTGSITPTGALKRQTNKKPTGTITPAGALKKLAKKPFAGGITPTGLLKKLTRKRFTGGITPSGALNISSVFFVHLSGTITPVGSLALALAKVWTLHVAGSITPVGVLSKRVAKKIAGSITPTGSLRKAIRSHFSGVLTPTGILTRFRVAVDFFTIITKAASLGSIITKAVLAPVITRANALGIPITRKSSVAVEVTQEDSPSTDINQ